MKDLETIIEFIESNSTEIVENIETESLLNITGNRIYEEFKKLLKKVKLNNKKFTLHCLRHTIATQLLEQGMEMEKVRDFLGHQYLGTTQIYTRMMSYEFTKLPAK